MSIFRPENDEQNLIPDIVKLHFSNHNFDLADYAVCFSSNFPKLFLKTIFTFSDRQDLTYGEEAEGVERKTVL